MHLFNKHIIRSPKEIYDNVNSKIVIAQNFYLLTDTDLNWSSFYSKHQQKQEILLYEASNQKATSRHRADWWRKRPHPVTERIID